MTEIELVWLAGLLEGEGCFDFYKWGSSPSPRIRLHMTDEDVVQRAADLIGRKLRRDKRLTTAGSQVFSVAIVGAEAYVLMQRLLPHMGRRRSERIRSCLADYEALHPAL